MQVPKFAILLYPLFRSPVLGFLIRTDSVAKRTRGWTRTYSAKSRHLGGLSLLAGCCSVVFYLHVSFPLLALPSRSSVHSAIYMVPVLSCHPDIHSFVFVRRCKRDENRREKTGQVNRERLSQSVDEMNRLSVNGSLVYIILFYHRQLYLCNLWRRITLYPLSFISHDLLRL